MLSLLLHAQLLVERSLILVYFQILSICKKGSSAPMSAPGGVLLILAILVVMLLVTTWLCRGRGEGRRSFVINLQVTVNLMNECSPKVIFLTSESGTLFSHVLSAAKRLLWLVLLLLLLLLLLPLLL